jgi:hypothetical protein
LGEVNLELRHVVAALIRVTQEQQPVPEAPACFY